MISPELLRIFGVGKLPGDVRGYVKIAKEALAKGRMDYRSRRGGDVEVAIEIKS